jgi:hypothetical protein
MSGLSDDLDFDVVGFETVLLMRTIAGRLVAGTSAATVSLYDFPIDND